MARHGKEWGGASEGVTKLVRSAEKFISAGNYELALEQLNVAKQLAPGNSYIGAIIDRINHLQSSPEALEDTARFLSITVGAEFQDGIKPSNEQPASSSQELQLRVRHLTNVAEKFYEQGSHENAFDSLLKAYILDPVSPYVTACEKVILPAWEKLHPIEHSTVNSLTTLKGEQHMSTFNPNGTRANHVPGVSSPESANGKGDQEHRLEMLKQQKEYERREKERAVWREASKPPRVFGAEEFEPRSTPATQKPTVAKPEQGFFAKLMKGRLLQ